MIASPGDRDRQRDPGANSAAYCDDLCWGMVVRGCSRQNDDYSLAQAYTSLGQAKGLTAVCWRRCAHEGGVGGELIRSAQA